MASSSSGSEQAGRTPFDRRSSSNSQQSHEGLFLHEFKHEDIHVSCPEKIVICVDLSQEVQTSTVNYRDNDVSILLLWKSALELFVWNKSMLNSEHQFALVVLTDTAHWFCDFNSDPECVSNAINSLQPMEENFETFDNATLYSTIYENCPPPPPTDNPLLPPPFTVRVILLYGRSHSLPVFKGEPRARTELYSSPYFFLDVFYAHDPPGPSNSSETIFYILAEMNPNPKSVVLDWSHSVTHLFSFFAKLLAHPLQRPLQSLMQNKLLSSSSNEPSS